MAGFDNPMVDTDPWFMDRSTPERTTTMNVSLPESLRDFAHARLASGFGSLSEYVRELIRRDQRELQRDEVEKRLLAALESPKSAIMAKDWKALRGGVQATAARRGARK